MITKESTMNSKKPLEAAKQLDQFFTDGNVAQACLNRLISLIEKESILFDAWLEPSAGSGAFFNILPSNKEKVGIDIDPKIEGIAKADFLSITLPKQDYITVGNPPFGKNASLAIAFFNKASAISTIVAFIVPKTFKKASVINRLDRAMHLIEEMDIPKNAFLFMGLPYDVPCVFQIWKKKPFTRNKLALNCQHKDIRFVKQGEANVAFQRVGVNAGSIKDTFQTASPSSHYFLKIEENVKAILKTIDWNRFKLNCAGCPSIAKTEIILAYSERIKA